MKTKRRGWLMPESLSETRKQQARIILRSASRHLSGPEADELRHVANGGTPHTTFYTVKVRGEFKTIEDSTFRRLLTEFSSLF